MDQTILLAEDDSFVRNFVSTLLRPKGYVVLMADCAKSALERARKATRLDLLIADLGLPDLSGPRLFDLVSALHPGIRPLYISGCTEEEAAYVYKPDGFNGEFLGKPFLSKELLSRIDQILMKGPPG